MNITVIQKSGLSTPDSFSAPITPLEMSSGVSLTSSLVFQSTAPGTNADYIKYLFDRAVRTDTRNEPTTLDFTLVNWDGNLQLLHRGNYIVLNTLTYPNWFTGYVTSEPELTYLGTTKRGGVIIPVWGYVYQATDSTFILNQQPLGLMPPFVNTTQGAILRALAQRLQPNNFNAASIQDGKLIARYVVAPDKYFSDVVKEFAEAAYYRFYAIGNALFFEPAASSPTNLIVDGNDKHFTPSDLSIKAAQEAVYNDAVVLGGIEPQGRMNEWFLGDGFTARLPLISSVYGADSSILLDDDFGASNIDTSKWSVFDTVNNWLRVFNGYLNAIGGNNDGLYTTYLTSANLLPMEGALRLTHGEYDFVSASRGIICGLWTNAPNSTYTGCLYAVACSKSGANTVLNPVAAGVLDTTQSFTVDYTKRYVLRTLVTFTNATRLTSSYSYLNSSGAVGSYGGGTTADTATYQTIIVEIDPTTGNITKTINWQNANVALTSNQYFAYYVPLALDDLHCTVTGITISTPMQVQLKLLYKNGLGYTLQGSGAGITGTADACQFVYQPQTGDGISICRVTSIVNTNADAKAGLMVRQSTAVGDPMAGIFVTPTNGVEFVTRATAGASAVVTTVAGITTNVWLKLSIVGGLYSGYYSVDGLNWIQVGTSTAITMSTTLVGLVTTATNNSVKTTSVFDHIVTPSGTGSWTSVDVGSVGLAGSAVSTGVMATNGISAWVYKIVGPNEIDSLDGMTPIATIVDANSGVTTRSSSLGSAMYNPGNAALQFFKDSTQQVTQVPQPGDLIHLTYRRAGAALARVSNLANVSTEAAAWGDIGFRTITKRDLSPLPRTSAECELAAAALVQDMGYQHYEGTYKVTNLYSIAGHPVSGALLTFQNPRTGFPAVPAEVVTGVKSTFVSSKPREVFEHEISFGKPDKVRQLLTDFSTPTDVFMPQDTAEIPDTFDLASLGSTTVSDVFAPTLSSWDSSYLYFNTNQAPPSGGGFEVRYTDESWGVDDAKNLITRTTGQTFQVPRTARGKICFVKGYDARNKLLYSEDFTQSAWVKGSSATVANSTTANPDANVSQISAIAFTDAGASAYVYQEPGVALTSTTGEFSISVKGTPGNIVRVALVNTSGGATLVSADVTLSSTWKRVTVTYIGGVGAPGNFRCVVNNTPGSVQTVYVTRASFELASVETLYCKTMATTYGATSRFAAGLHVEFPLLPPAPTATVEYTNKLKPVITVSLPAAAGDVWGVEIRDSDNVTVLFSKDLTATDFVPSFGYDNSTVKTRNLSFYVYTYNLLGEYSASGYHLVATIPTPAISAGPTVDDLTKLLVWTATNADGYKVEIDKVSMAFGSESVSTTSSNPYYALTDTDFFFQRYFRITPYDSLGDGTPATGSHVYTPAAVGEFNGNEAQVVSPPSTPTTSPSVPAAYADYASDYVTHSWDDYYNNNLHN